jgi:uncharacterized membrane protein
MEFLLVVGWEEMAHFAYQTANFRLEDWINFQWTIIIYIFFLLVRIMFNVILFKAQNVWCCYNEACWIIYKKIKKRVIVT